MSRWPRRRRSARRCIAACCRSAPFARRRRARFGIVSRGLALDPTNPPASVFRYATGEFGYRLFGVVMWSAAITSVVGAAYTSVSFLSGLHVSIDQRWTRMVGAYRHPRWLTASGVAVTLSMAAAGAFVLWRDIPGLLR